MRTLSDGTPILAKPKMIDTLEEALDLAFDEDEQEVLIRVEGYVSRKSKNKADITLNISYDYKELVQDAIDHVNSFTQFDTSVAPKDVWKVAKQEVLESLSKSLLDQNPRDYVSRSSEQIFDNVDNVLVGFSSGMIQVRGVMVDYKLVEKGEERVVKSRPKTLAKKAMLEGTFRGTGIGSLRTMALDTPRFDYIFVNNMRYDSSGFSLEIENNNALRVFSGDRGHSERIQVTNKNQRVSLDLGTPSGTIFQVKEELTVEDKAQSVESIRKSLNIRSSCVALAQIQAPKTLRTSTLTGVMSSSGRFDATVLKGSSNKPLKIGPSPGSRVYVEVKRESTKIKPGMSVIFVEESSSQIVINLNWDRVRQPIDLDLCVLLEMKDGSTDCLEAIRGNFGNLDSYPFVLHSGDDLTGDFAEGEYLYVSLEHLKQIKRMCVFAYIYRGAKSWKNAKGVIWVDVPGHPLLEVPMGEQTSPAPLCAICMIEVDGDQIHLERLVSFHGSMRHPAWHGSWQNDLDAQYSWNMNW